MNNDDDELAKKFGEIVEWRRKDRDLTLQQLGELIGISPDRARLVVYRVERGENTRFDIVCALVKELNIDLRLL